nr:hypothetical protein [Halomonas sp.]
MTLTADGNVGSLVLECRLAARGERPPICCNAQRVYDLSIPLVYHPGEEQ